MLFDNPNPIIGSATVSYETRRLGMTVSKISPSASVGNFRQLAVYRINVDGKNSLLKYKGGVYSIQIQ